MGAMKSLAMDIEECGADLNRVNDFINGRIEANELTIADRCALGIESPERIEKCKKDFAKLIEMQELDGWYDALCQLTR